MDMMDEVPLVTESFPLPTLMDPRATVVASNPPGGLTMTLLLLVFLAPLLVRPLTVGLHRTLAVWGWRRRAASSTGGVGAERACMILIFLALLLFYVVLTMIATGRVARAWMKYYLLLYLLQCRQNHKGKAHANGDMRTKHHVRLEASIGWRRSSSLLFYIFREQMDMCFVLTFTR